MKYRLAHYSLPGARANNEDRLAYAERENAVFMALADGLGGHAGGAIAAEILTRWSVQAFKSVKQPLITQPSAFLALTILQAHDQIISYSQARYPDIEPRTTCVLCLVQNGYAYWAHVGDSRLYHFRNGSLLQRTLDHSAIENLRQQGLITEQEMQNHPQKSHITRCVGGRRQKPPVTLGEETKLQPGDRLLLCSDGVWEALTPEDLISFLRKEPLDEGIEDMLHAAEDKMKKMCDNVTAIHLSWEDQAIGPPLQSNSTVTVDERTLRKQARKKVVTTKNPTETIIKKPPPAPKAGLNKKEIKQQIQDLENYLAQLGQKPDTKF